MKKKTFHFSSTLFLGLLGLGGLLVLLSCQSPKKTAVDKLNKETRKRDAGQRSRQAPRPQKSSTGPLIETDLKYEWSRQVGPEAVEYKQQLTEALNSCWIPLAKKHGPRKYEAWIRASYPPTQQPPQIEVKKTDVPVGPSRKCLNLAFSSIESPSFNQVTTAWIQMNVSITATQKPSWKLKVQINSPAELSRFFIDWSSRYEKSLQQNCEKLMSNEQRSEGPRTIFRALIDPQGKAQKVELLKALHTPLDYRQCLEQNLRESTHPEISRQEWIDFVISHTSL